VVYTTAALDGVEIEVKSRDSDWGGTHVAVRRRSTGHPGEPLVFAAIFGQLAAGQYAVRVRGSSSHPRTQTITVVGGEVTETTFVD
jgi:hypothetical protein